MAEPTLEEVFGTGATQTATALSVLKSAMTARGLTASASNTGESMFVFMILQAAINLTESNRLTDLVNRNVSVAYSGQDLIDQGGTSIFLRDTYQVSLYRATTVQAIDPDNY